MSLQREDCVMGLLVLIVVLMLVQMLDNRAMRAEIAGYKQQLDSLQTQLARNVEL